MTSELVTHDGKKICLGRELGRGGEGSVFEVEQSGLVAKVYHTKPDRDRAEKLAAMVKGASDKLLKVAAWPSATLHSSAGGPTCGFLMPRVDRHKDIHILYGPKTRVRDYPDATYRFLVHVAGNLARAFAVVHDHGHVIGDVNQGGVCVSTQGTITLVDCDSFQVSSNGRSFTCDVGIPHYQPPELQSATSFRGLRREANHDRFGLAVLIFQTLFLARHPFSGQYLGSEDMSLEKAIAEFRFAYGRESETRRKMRQPAGTLGLGALSPEMATLFERAFSEEGPKGSRPTAHEWITALDAYVANLQDCKQNGGHAYLKGLSACPLCNLEHRFGTLLFLPPSQASTGAPVVDLEGLWRDLVPVIEGARPIPAGAALATLPGKPAAVPDAAVITYRKACQKAAGIGWAGAAVSLLGLFLLGPFALLGTLAAFVVSQLMRPAKPQVVRDAPGKLEVARRRVDEVLREFEHDRAAVLVRDLGSQAKDVHDRLKDFPRRRLEALKAFERTKSQRQLSRFLDQYEVAKCGLKGFGTGLFATLVSNGIETADDLSEKRLADVSGFGPKRIAALMAWKRALESRFRPNPNAPEDARELARLEGELNTKYQADLIQLRRLAEQIKAAARPVAAHRENLRQQLVSLRQSEAEAEANIAVLQGRAA